MNKKRFGLFGKIFLYTILFLSAAILVFSLIYAGQLETAFMLYERGRLTREFEPLLELLEGKSRAERAGIISDFASRNETFAFSIRLKSGEVLYETPNFYMSDKTLKEVLKEGSATLKDLGKTDFVFSLDADENVTIYIAKYAESGYGGTFKQVLPVSLVLLGISAAGAFIFAGLISRPIKHLAFETVKMSELQSVSKPKPRSDEIGMLTENVYAMYERLRVTISMLEREVEQSKKLEERQRYFFSAASHELKTPVAALTAILEALIGGVIEPPDYPSYFRQGLNLMTAQTKLIGEILEIVRLDDAEPNLTKNSFNLLGLVRSVLADHQTLAENRGQSIHILVSEDVCCYTDEHLLSRVLSNVVLNAVQNTPECGSIRVWSERSVTHDGYIRLKVLNTDSRIDGAASDKLFQHFFRADKSREFGKSGLGLTIVQKTLGILEIPFLIENSEDGVMFWMDIPLDGP